jgi:hypothetical protein
MTPEPPPTGASPWRLVAAIGSQTAVLVALLFYFGWASAGATFGYFGVSLSLLGFGTSDYLLRSIYSAFQPLLIVGLVALVAICAHQTAMAFVARGGERRRQQARRLPVIAVVAGMAAVLIAVAGLVIHPVVRVLGQGLPAVLAIGALATAYGDHLWPRLRGGEVALADDVVARRLRTFVLVTIAILGGFWWLAVYAADTGEDRAMQLAEDLPSASEVALYTAQPLAITGPGVGRDVFADEDLKYQYRYTGLRLLIRADDQYFLLPRGWMRGRDSVFVVPESGDVRIEIIAAQ